jgi:hypothetical protein
LPPLWHTFPAVPLDYPSPPLKDEVVDLRPWDAGDLQLTEDARTDP